MKFTVENIDDYKNKITDKQAKLLIRHCNRYNIAPDICAWYDDMDDFYSEWVDAIGYTKSQAKKLLIGKEEVYLERNGEFKKFPNGEIVRLTL